MYKSSFLSLALLFFSTSSLAGVDSEKLKQTLEAEASCQNFVRYDEQNVYLGFGKYQNGFEEPRNPIPATIKIIPIGNPKSSYFLKTADAAIDAIVSEKTLFLLTYSGIEQWDLATKSRVNIYPTTTKPAPLAAMEQARAFARYGDKALIAHGRLGLSIFDLKEKRITKELPLVVSQRPLESTAMDIIVDGKYAFILMDSFSLVGQGKQALRGLVILDLDRETVVKELDGMDPGADALVGDGKNLVVSFSGLPLFKYSLGDLQGNDMPEPLLRVTHYPLAGHPVGKASWDAKYYYSCFQKDPLTPGGVYQKVPKALNRHDLGLLDQGLSY